MPLIPLIIALIIATGTGTAVSANLSKPGDTLYGLDQFMENIQENMPMSQSNRVNFLSRLNKERAKELADLQAINIETLNQEDQARLEGYQEDAIDRLAASIEKLEAVSGDINIIDSEELEEVSSEVIDSSDDDITPVLDNYKYTSPLIPSITLPSFLPLFNNDSPPLVDDSSDNYIPEDEPWGQGPSD